MKEENQTEKILYLCGTPIGNLEDITIRAVNILKEVDLIAAEDTRHTRKLLNHFQISTPVTSYYEHNQGEKAPYLIEKIKCGTKVALVSDAGMPGISDPGYLLVKLALKHKIKVVAIPGVTALITALVISGLPTNQFIFGGFLPRKSIERRRFLRQLTNEDKTIIFYETPHRLLKALEDILELWGDRKIALARELTKRYEEVKRGTISQILDILKKEEIRGEITLVIEGNPKAEKKMEEEITSNNKIVVKFIQELKKEQYSSREIIRLTQEKFNLPRNIIYQKLLELKENLYTTNSK